MKILVRTMDFMGKLAATPPATEPTFAMRHDLWKLVHGMHSASVKKEKNGQPIGIELHLELVGSFGVLETAQDACKRLGRDARALIMLVPKDVEHDPGVFVRGRKLIV